VEDRPQVGSVFYVSLALSLGFLAVGLAAPDRLADVLEDVRRFVVGTFGLGYVGIVFALLPFLLLLAATPFGRTRLGGSQDRPEFGWVSWIAMIFSAGVGLSFLFWGTAEPLIHFADPPQGSDVAGTEEAARAGLRYSFLFWGLHAWATYGVVAVAVGYAGFRSGRSMLISSALHPLLGDRVDGVVGRVVDVMAVVAILFGVATSLGLGTRELNASLADQFDVPESHGVRIAIIVGLMTVSTISALTGLGRGISSR
jgi:glycine betaine transporter